MEADGRLALTQVVLLSLPCPRLRRASCQLVLDELGDRLQETVLPHQAHADLVGQISTQVIGPRRKM